MSVRATWKKAEKLKSRKHIDRVFREGKSFTVFPYKVVFLVGGGGAVLKRAASATAGTGSGAAAREGAAAAGEALTVGGAAGMDDSDSATAGTGGGAEVSGSGAAAPLQAGFGASSRNFKKAVDRNRIKRLGREAYRLQKEPLIGQLTRKGVSMAVFFVYIGKDLPDYPTVSTRIGVALQKLLKETA